MRTCLIAIGIAVSALAQASYFYAGDWQTNLKTWGPSNIKITGTKVDAYIRNNYTGLGYQITGNIVNKVFSGFLTSNGHKWPCTGTGTYGLHTLKFTLRANGTGFILTGAK